MKILCLCVSHIHFVDICFQLHEDKLIQEAEATKVTQARNLALAKEKLRAQQVASLPPPVKPDLKQLLNKAKAAYVQVCGILRVMNGIIYVTHALYYGYCSGLKKRPKPAE